MTTQDKCEDLMKFLIESANNGHIIYICKHKDSVVIYSRNHINKESSSKSFEEIIEDFSKNDKERTI